MPLKNIKDNESSSLDSKYLRIFQRTDVLPVPGWPHMYRSPD